VQIRTPWRKRPVLAYPIPPAPPTAILVGGFRSLGNLRVFENGWNEEAAAFAPCSIAATPEQLDALRGTSLPSLRNVLIALVRPGEPGLSEEARERLWWAFRVPIFEQRIDDDCTLLAAECEAHEGLHIEASGVFPRANESLETAKCGCGKTTPRLMMREKVGNLRRVAAYAR
jgi:hypothetical protein